MAHLFLIIFSGGLIKKQMKFNSKEKKTAGDAIFVALTDLMASHKSKANTIALWGFILRNYILQNKLPKYVQLNEKEINRNLLNLLFLFLENMYQKIKEKAQIPEAFTPLNYIYTLEARLDPEGTTVPAQTIKINITPKMIRDVNALISKLGHEG
jgi:hypothetical protein